MDARSERNLRGVHHALVSVVHRADRLLEDEGAGLRFIVTEGLRSKARQAELVKAGASWTMNSRHLTGHAVDLAATLKGRVRWDWPLYHRLAAAMKSAALAEGVQITWGGDWRTKRDGPHFELDRQVYSA